MRQRGQGAPSAAPQHPGIHRPRRFTGSDQLLGTGDDMPWRVRSRSDAHGAARYAGLTVQVPPSQMGKPVPLFSQSASATLRRRVLRRHDPKPCSDAPFAANIEVQSHRVVLPVVAPLWTSTKSKGRRSARAWA